MPTYQELLKIPTVHDLISREINAYTGHPSGKRELVNVSDTYYLRDAKENLTKIQQDTNISGRMAVIFDTFEYYTEHSEDPYALFFRPLRAQPFICPTLLNSFYHTRPDWKN